MVAVKPEETSSTAGQKTAPPIDGIWLAPPAPRPRRTPGQYLVALVRGLGSLAGLMLLLVGLPAALVYGVGWPLPRGWPQVWAWLNGPTRITIGGIVDAGVCVLWLMWAGIVVAVVVEIVAAMRHVRVPRLPLASPLQGLAAGLVGTAVIALTGTGARAVPPPQTTPAAATANPLPPSALTLDAPGISVSTSTAVRGGQVTLLVAGIAHTYTVQPDDNLSHIARDWLGCENRWPEIYDLNRGRHFPAVGGTLTDPDLIYPGWTLFLPDDAQPPGSDSPTPPPARTTPPPAPPTVSPDRPPASPSPTSPSWAGPSVTPSAPAAGPGGLVTPPIPAATPTVTGAPAGPLPPPPTSAAGTHRPAAHSPARGVGVSLPGGWVSLPLAAAIALAGGMVWRWRRRRYRPGPLAGPVLHDPDLPPLPAVVDMARREVRRHAPDLLRPPRDTLTVREAAELRRAGQPLPPPPPPGPHGPQLAGLPDPLPPGGLGLTGPGSEDAARGLLVATLSAGSPDDPDARGQVIIPASTLATLLGAAAVGLGELPRMTVTADLAGALTHVEELIIARRRLVDDEDAPDVDTLPTDRYHLAVPLALLIAEVPDPPLRARLCTALHLGRPLAVAAVLLGGWPRGETTRVDTDGTTDAQRLAVLDVATASDLLHVLREAHTGQRVSYGPADPTQPPAPKPQPQPAEPGGRVSTEVSSPPTGASSGAATQPGRADDGRVRAPAQVLGPPVLYRLDGTPIDGLREVALELLVYLAVHRDGASLEDIKEAIYGDATRERAKQRLQTDVGNLRNRIRHILAIRPEDGDPVINTGGHYHLNPDLIQIDWWAVQDALATTAAADPGQREHGLRRAVDAFHGALAEGTEYEWVLQDQEHVRRQGVVIHTHLAALLADTDPAQAGELLDAACTLDPFNEDLTQAAMRAHARTGNADAIRHRLGALKTALDELDEEPDEATLELANDLVVRLRKPPAGPLHE
ncbi:MAG TPA: BTAD domain-containing putative transcriptional regulator [Planosporangium sp.]|nr:BTAD domain-containing putative transcriptional regulator [Planosporangium sp.]